MSGPKGIDFYYGDGTPTLAGQSFDVIKASEGASFPPDGPIPDWYTSEQAKIRAAGALFGAYLFWHPSVDNAAQLANFRKRANLRAGDLIQLDCEVTDGLDWVTVNTRKNDMLHRLRAAFSQCRVLLYTYLDFFSHLDSYVADGLWIADPNSPPGQPRVPQWVIHQYASSGVDYDIANFTDATMLRAWATGLLPTPPVPAPIPTPLEGLPMELLAYVQADPANPTVNQGIWYYDTAAGLALHLSDPHDVTTWQGANPALKSGPVTFATHERFLATCSRAGK